MNLYHFSIALILFFFFFLGGGGKILSRPLDFYIYKQSFN
jgi:hypothetical protein